MTQDDDRMPESLRNAARGYNNPPELNGADLDAMWSAVEREAFGVAHSTVERRPGGVARFFTTPSLLQMAAVLVLGVAIGRFAIPKASNAPTAEDVASRLVVDSLAVPELYQNTTSRYLGQAAALLVSLPADGREGRGVEPDMGRAHDLLLTTRLLLDSPAAADPRFRALLEDLELVLAQVVRLQSAESREELELIRQALEQRDVLPRLRTAAADISADD